MLTNGSHCSRLCTNMAQPLLSESVKTRISSKVKEKLDQIAARKELGIADIVREALREYADRNFEASQNKVRR